MDGHTRGLRGRLACHCLLLELAESLVLIDTGFGLRDVAAPSQRLSSFFVALLSPDFREQMTARRQIEQLGFSARDVRHIVLTHLDFDHAGGLDDFPAAQVHMLHAERVSAFARTTLLDQMRYRPQQWSTRDRWQTYSPLQGESWFGFECVRQLSGIPPEILLVPLIGHTLGHAGVAIRASASQWLLQAGDAYFYSEEMNLERPYCTPGLRFYQWMMEKDRTQRLRNQERLRNLKLTHGTEVRILSSHDVLEFETAAQHAVAAPVGMTHSPHAVI
ncbi:MAG TPA: MBL fold metallo-hydrolase [Steroidobacteraceae bacterium]